MIKKNLLARLEFGPQKVYFHGLRHQMPTWKSCVDFKIDFHVSPFFILRAFGNRTSLKIISTTDSGVFEYKCHE